MHIARNGVEAAERMAAPQRWGLTRPGGLLGGGHAGYQVLRAQDGWVALAALEPALEDDRVLLLAQLQMDRGDHAAAVATLAPLAQRIQRLCERLEGLLDQWERSRGQLPLEQDWDEDGREDGGHQPAERDARRLERLAERHEPLGGVGTAVEQDVFDAVADGPDPAGAATAAPRLVHAPVASPET